MTPQTPQKRIAILGSTGSIGTQALQVIAAHPDHFQVEVLTAQHNADLLIEQSLAFRPNVVVIGNEDLYDKVFAALDPAGVKVYTGPKALAAWWKWTPWTWY
jgi:1-deoxy-D-xylulose-5-phosphate reductoisomerase